MSIFDRFTLGGVARAIRFFKGWGGNGAGGQDRAGLSGRVSRRLTAARPIRAMKISW